MAQKPKSSVKPDDSDEYKRFLATAKEVEADENPKAFDEAFRRVTAPLSQKENS